MNIFHKVTLQSLKKNKTRTLVTIIGIILSAAMICAVTTFASSFLNYMLQTAIYDKGDWHGKAKEVTKDTLQAVQASDEVKSVTYLQQLGYAVAEGCQNEYKPYIYLLGAGEGTLDTLPIHITAGNFPVFSDQILLPEHLATNGGVSYSIGDTVTLELGSRMFEGHSMNQNNPAYFYGENGEELLNETLEIREQRTYTVVGFYERLSYDIEDYSAPGYTAITLADNSPADHYTYEIFFKMQEPDTVYGFMEEMQLNLDTNSDVLMYLGTSQYNGFQTMLSSLCAIVIGLIMFGSVSLIYNAFSISVSERTKQFGLLSSIGATRKQLRRMVIFEALAVSAVGIPIGIACGVGGIGVTLALIGDKFRSFGYPIDMELSVSVMSIVIAAIVALVTVLISAWIPSKRATKVSAVEAIRQTQDISTKGKPVRTSRLTYKLFGLPGVLANKHYKRSKKKYRSTIISLFMSIVLFVSASAFTDYLVLSVSDTMYTENYDIRFSDDSYEEFQNEGYLPLLQSIRGAKDVTDAACSWTKYINIRIDRSYLTDKVLKNLNSYSNQGENPDPDTAHIHAYVSFVDDDSFRALLKENKLSEKQYMDPHAPLAITIDGNLSFNYVEEKYETIRYLNADACSLNVIEEKEIDGYVCMGEIVDESGNTVVRYGKFDANYNMTEEYMDLSPEEAYTALTLNSGKTIYSRPYYLTARDGITLLYPMSFAETVLPGYAFTYGYGFYMTSSDHTQSYNSVKSILAENGYSTSNLHDQAEVEESDRNLVVIIRVFAYGFIILISLIAAANVFNTISTNISLRRREFALLKSVGMPNKDFHRMMNYECLLYGSRALFYGLPAAVGVAVLIWMAFAEGYKTDFMLPWTAILIAVCSVFAVVFATMLYAMRKVNKDNPIDTLKNENL